MRRDLRRRETLPARLDPSVAVFGFDDFERREFALFFDFVLVVAAANQALDGEQRPAGIRDRLAFGDDADELLRIFAERHDRRRGARALGVFDDDRLAVFDDGDARIGGAEIDADDFTHCCFPAVAGRLRGILRRARNRPRARDERRLRRRAKPAR